jgi:glutamate N-acetyltransferase/amino-acid N-acetyltransferase
MKPTDYEKSILAGKFGEEAKKILSRGEITITVDLHMGKGSASFWTCDLSGEYVAINANYST